ncbi:hypothetical protein ABGN05_13975 [Aquibium sp. LZ166]|uniref:Uncharacterized protein n=1 Tax=Aquibium pacificus TaxID=3153579 RepID=A0ABV3SJ85_9HYPH
MPRPRHQPDPQQCRQVEALAGYGTPEHEIAAMIGIDPKTLRRHYRQELDLGHTKANARVAENLFRKATGDGRESVTAAIFWLKTRARWKEVSIHELGGVPGQPIEHVDQIDRIVLVPFDGSVAVSEPLSLPSTPRDDGRTIRQGLPR